MSVLEAAKILSTQPSEQETSLPPAEVETEGQEAQASQDAKPEANQAEPATPDNGDTEAKQELFKVKVDGEELEVELDELKKGYSREQHYQKKARDLAADREALGAKASIRIPGTKPLTGPIGSLPAGKSTNI